ncbi:hypothetical protein HAX54_023087 [Datura stramonium]|uniref:GST C-terminal domain-containing protein n=1 Tax=Datura stramonium TaxID=4076 RepID=A0ABS8UWV8_DATST|nr:hypothetical protein [Datura stramonium]
MNMSLSKISFGVKTRQTEAAINVDICKRDIYLAFKDTDVVLSHLQPKSNYDLGSWKQSESIVILEYTGDMEAITYPPLEDPYERAKARFWAKFVDDKEQQKIAKEARENLKILEGELGKKRFFGDTKIGLRDVASAWIICWAQIVEEIVDIKLIDAEEMPSLVSWFQRPQAAPILKECTPPKDKLLEHNNGFHKMLVASASP